MQQQGIDKKKVFKLIKNDDYKEFHDRLLRGEDIYEKKFRRIRDSRLVAKMELPRYSSVAQHGNDPDNLKDSTRSRYQSTLLKAIGDSIMRDLMASNPRFEWSANDKVGVSMKRAYDDILTKAYSYAGTARARNKAYHHLVFSGTAIIQTYSSVAREERISANGVKKSITQGRIISFNVYDPLMTILDWNADSSNVDGTSEFIIVGLGRFRKEQLVRMFPECDLSALPDMNNDLNSQYVVNNTGYTNANSSSTNRNMLRLSAGEKATAGFDLFEYYTRDGYRKVMIRDYGHVGSYVNSNGVSGKIPFIVAPLFYDEDTPYGMSLYEMIQQPLDVIATAINHIADNNSITVRSPLFTFKGLLPKGFTIEDSTFYDIVALDVDAMSIGGTLNTYDIQKMISRLTYPEVTQGALFLVNMAFDDIWYATGMNKTSLGGIQEKQIRVAGAAEMMSQGSLRSSSVIISNNEVYLMNPLVKQYAQMMSEHYDDFHEFKANGIDKELVDEIQQHIRVVNGSYLPADQYNEMQKTQVLYQIGSQQATVDQTAILTDFLKAHGITYPERYYRDPITTLTAEQATRLDEIMRTQGIEAVKQVLEHYLGGKNEK